MKLRSRDVSLRSGKLDFIRKNSNHNQWRDLYRTVLLLTWPKFVLVVLGIYFGLNVLFALAYLNGGDCIAEMPRGSLSSAFFFSVQTLSTVGFGHLHPITAYGDVLTTIEILVGMFFTAVVTGLIFVRFSRPAANLLFSEPLVICPFDGRPSLQFRVANIQHQPMVEAEFRLMMVRKEDIVEEEGIRRFYTLKLEYNHLTMFPSALTIRHLIDEQSPLYGVTAEQLKKSHTRFFTSIVCIDTVTQSSVQSQMDYLWDDVRFGHRFVEIYVEHEDGTLEVDYGRIHETEPVASRS